MKREIVKKVGILLIIVGTLWATIAFNMSTSVNAGGETFGSGEYSIKVPQMKVNNLGLMEDRRNHLMFSGLTILIGVVLFGFGSMSDNRNIPAPGPIDKTGTPGTTGTRASPLTAMLANPVTALLGVVFLLAGAYLTLRDNTDKASDAADANRRKSETAIELLDKELERVRALNEATRVRLGLRPSKNSQLSESVTAPPPASPTPVPIAHAEAAPPPSSPNAETAKHANQGWTCITGYAQIGNRCVESRSTRSKRKKEGVQIGMSMEEVRQSSWGRPNSVNRTVTSSGTHEQWVYGGGYLYFEDGILTTVQN
jgi:hypothetical protein